MSLAGLRAPPIGCNSLLSRRSYISEFRTRPKTFESPDARAQASIVCFLILLLCVFLLGVVLKKSFSVCFVRQYVKNHLYNSLRDLIFFIV